jgi:fructose-1,6-bisphosphatase/inositol monophosphatase family enzyme
VKEAVVDLNQALSDAQQLARDSGDIMLKYFFTDMDIDIKADDTPVTVADRKVNRMVVEFVKAKYPDFGVLGEEESYQPEGRGWLWVCDPIDGTKPYTLGVPLAMFSLALVHDGRPVVAVTYDPFMKQLYSAVKGQGAYMNGKRMAVRQQGFDGCMLGGPGMGNVFNDDARAARILRQHGAKLIRFSGTVYQGMLVARGKLDGFAYKYDKAWDIAALKLIVEESGGKVTDRQGQEMRCDRPVNGAIVSNGLVHDRLLDLAEIGLS